MTVEEYLKRKKKVVQVSNSYKFLIKFMVTILLTIASLITLKIKPDLKPTFYNMYLMIEYHLFK